MLTLEMAITAEFQEKLQQLNIGGGKERQTRIECTVKVLHGNLAQLQLVRDSPHNPEKLIALDETPTGEGWTTHIQMHQTHTYTRPAPTSYH